ncbi:MAG: DEAD/DEAH box helicase [Alicyclobacillus sp.]|nr:DEAD/DEAH box helicase [Alicyclobacillus sp.]
MRVLIVEEMGKWGRLWLQPAARGRLLLRGSAELVSRLAQLPEVRRLAAEARPEGIVFPRRHRAAAKQVLCNLGHPVIDKAGYQAAPPLRFSFRPETQLRDYQVEAVERFFDHSREQSGVVVLPCGAGKTLVGLAIVARLGLHALVLVPSETAARQWLEESLARTTLRPEEVSLYRPDEPLAPLTITTYQRLTARDRSGERRHFAALANHPWGIVIYDEVHMLPAPLFRLAADLQSARRLGLTATLVREDGADTDIFSLIGPKCFEVPWRELERRGFLAAVRCVEVRVPLSERDRARYAAAAPRAQHRLAALNEGKLAVVEALARRHQGESVLIIGHYLESLQAIADRLGCPVLTGQTPQPERERLFDLFRTRTVRCLALSRVANMSVDLPCASVAIQVSGLFGSRQEEAQRLGRLLRPQVREGVFYTLVSRDTVEERMAKHRQMYLVEQGYAYETWDADALAEDRVALALRTTRTGTERTMEREVVGMPERR